MDWSFLIRNKESLSVSTDTRNLPAGCVFFALHGANFDGNQFAQQALDKGASLVVIDDPKAFLGPQTLLVPDTLKALQSLARAWRRQWAAMGNKPMLAITGTNGKTTTKELLASVLSTRYRVLYTQGNLNNSIGVPLTLLSLTAQHEMAIIEMGASHPGDIRELVEVAEPDYGLITNVGKAHLQGFGSFEGVMRTKAELYDYLLSHHGEVFLNEDNPHLREMYTTATQGIEGCFPHLYHRIPMLEGTHLVGDYNAENIAAALAVGQYFGVPRTDGMAAIRAYVPSNNRSQAMQTSHNSLVVDAYNANPSSMQVAINAFQGDTYILGAMRELGDYSHLEHQNVVNMLLERKAELVYLVGNEWKQTTAPYPIFETVEDLAAYLTTHPLTQRHILIKGSNSNHLDRILPCL